MAKPLSPDLMERLIALGAEGLPSNRIARELGVGIHTVEKYRDGCTGPGQRDYVRPPEQDVMMRLAEIPPDRRDLTSRFCGDPLPGRSALDRRRAAR